MADTKKKKNTPSIPEPTTTPDSRPEGLVAPDAPVVTPTPKVVTATPVAKKKSNTWLIWTAVAVVVLAAVGTVGWVMYGTPNNNSNMPATTSNSNANTNTTVMTARPLDGVMVPAAEATPNIMAVMIENASDSRPPSGLDKASVVYEALAEGGITRFMGLFPVGTQVKELGPVRSARPYYIAWAESYRPMYVHAGGSPQAIALLNTSSTSVQDFNQFTHGPYFWRDKTRAAPHNLYTSSDKLYLAQKQLYPNLTSTVQPWTFKEDAALDTLPETTKDIVIDYSSLNYKVTYKYDRGQNQYIRSLGNTPHVTRDGTQITAKNVVVMYMATSLISGDAKRLQMGNIGTGKAVVFRDGVAIVGTWKKATAQDREQFYDANGQIIPLDRGVTWISAVPANLNVTY